MLEQLKVVLDIQELDIKMIRLMKLKKSRQKELGEIDTLNKDLRQKITDKEEEITSIRTELNQYEEDISSVKEKIKQFEAQQDLVKKIEEFNALNTEISHADRERVNLEQKLNATADSLMAEEEVLTTLQETAESTSESSKALQEEINTNISQINAEGKTIKEQRDVLAKTADEHTMKIYQRLLNNKRDRVVVPIVNRSCSGCHIVLTAQQENLVRKGERLISCEHCSRILYWEEASAEEVKTSGKRRRKKTTTKS